MTMYSATLDVKVMDYLTHIFLDKIILPGWGGVGLLFVFGVINDIPGWLTGVAGAGLVFFSIYQKWRDDKRKQQRHERYLALIKKMEEGALPYDKELSHRLLPEEEKD